MKITLNTLREIVAQHTSGLAEYQGSLIVEIPDPDPVSMILFCPCCGERHFDEGVFATKLHHTHACQICGMVWRPALVNTVGVKFLPGFKNDPEGK